VDRLDAAPAVEYSEAFSYPGNFFGLDYTICNITSDKRFANLQFAALVAHGKGKITNASIAPIGITPYPQQNPLKYDESAEFTINGLEPNMCIVLSALSSGEPAEFHLKPETTDTVLLLPKGVKTFVIRWELRLISIVVSLSLLVLFLLIVTLRKPGARAAAVLVMFLCLGGSAAAGSGRHVHITVVDSCGSGVYSELRKIVHEHDEHLHDTERNGSLEITLPCESSEQLYAIPKSSSYCYSEKRDCPARQFTVKWKPVGVRPGDFVNPCDADKIADLVSPGVHYKVQHGMTMKIIPAERSDWPPPYKDATEKYSGQAKLSKDKRSLIGYVAGQPFPVLDPNDPSVATKIIWNNVFRPIATDDYDLRFYDCDSSFEKDGPQTKQIEHFQAEHDSRYSEIGRTEVEPIPADPDFKITGRYWLSGLYPILAPEEIRGFGFIRWRYADPTRVDDVWAFSPGTRRIKRIDESISGSTTSPGTSGHSLNPDDFSAFNPKTESYLYKFLGEKNMLACVHAEHSPEVPCATDGGTSACPEAWEMRHMYLVEAVPNGGIVDPLDERLILYVDSEMWFESYIDSYDHSGRLLRNRIYWLATRDRSIPDAKVAIFPFKRTFLVGAASTNVQSGLTTMCYLPGVQTPERECWYINMGAVDKGFFTTDAMVRAASFQ
jgi:hypothetical protein